MADTEDDLLNKRAYVRGFDDARSQKPRRPRNTPQDDFYNLGYDDGLKDD